MGIGDEPELPTTGTIRGLGRVEDVDFVGAGKIEASLRPGDEMVVRVFGEIVLGRIAGRGRLETETALPSCPGL